METTNVGSGEMIKLKDLISESMVYYRIGKPGDRRFFVTPKGSLEGWRRYIGKDEEVWEYKVKRAYIPLSRISFTKVDELQKKYDRGEIDDTDVEMIYPEETGIQNLEQYEIDIRDVISKKRIK